MLDTLSQRFDRLAPFVTEYGPEDDAKRPAVLLFHACNGVRDHIHAYARQAAEQGLRAFVVDSFAPRGWDYTAAISLVCSGLALHGYERSGDVLAAVRGLSQRPDVDADRLVLAGWSHGGWSIMDLMAQKLEREGEARLADPDPAWLAGVRGAFLVYPYINVPALSSTHAWVTRPKTLAVLADRDFLTPHHHAVGVLGHLRDEGVPMETVTLDATHCFDEDGMHFGPLMHYDAGAHAVTRSAFSRFLKETLD
ncbi:MAG: dienelactone hydrolase family protein [Asticcacaulis sp.]